VCVNGSDPDMIRGKLENLIHLTLRGSKYVELNDHKEEEEYLHNGVSRVS
jgi:hypothetical protein